MVTQALTWLLFLPPSSSERSGALEILPREGTWKRDYMALAYAVGNTLEKAILNLNLSKYPNVVQVRHICEEEFLSSALIHLLTTLFDDEKDTNTAVCISILCSLFNLMMRCKVEMTKEAVLNLPQYIHSQGTSLFEQLNT